MNMKTMMRPLLLISFLIPLLIPLTGAWAALPACLDGFTLYSHTQTLLGDRDSLATGKSGSNGYTELGIDGRGQADFVSRGNLKLRDRSRISGNAKAGGSVTLLSGAQVTGVITQGASVPICTLPTETFSVGSADFTVSPGATKDLLPGSYGDYRVSGNGILMLRQGTYRFKSLITEADGRLQLNPGTGNIEVFTSMSLAMGDRTQMNFTGGDAPEKVKFHSQQSTTLVLGTDIQFKGTVVAPLAEIHIFSRTRLMGSAFGGSIVCEPDVRFFSFPYGSGTDLVKITSPANGLLTNQPSIVVAWTVNGAVQSTLTTETLATEGANKVKRCSGTACDSITVVRDTQAPVVHISNPQANQIFNTSQILVAWTVDGTAQSTQLTQNLALEGPNWVVRVFTDAAGNIGRDSVLVIRDLVAPTVAILSPAPGQIFRTPTITVSWSVDGVIQTNQTSESLQDGTNLVKRIGLDAAGNKDSASITVYLDSVPPLVEIVSPLPGTLTKETSTAVVWKVDGVEQTTGTTENLIVEGLNTISRTATDAAGNIGRDSVLVIRDLVAPTVAILSPAPGQVFRIPSISVSWSVDGVVQSTQTSEALHDGANLLKRIGTDAAGNQDSASITVYLDSVPPLVEIVSPLTGAFSKETSTAVAWKVDGVVQTTATSEPLSLEGPNTITRTATDAAGNIGSASIAVIRDTQAPVVHISNPQANQLFNTSQIQVAWTVDGTAQSTQLTQSLTVEGPNWVVRTFTDAAGNIGRDSVLVIRDQVAPTVAILSPVDGAEVEDTVINVTWTVDGVAQTTETSAQLVDGENLIVRSATDGAGNTGRDTVVVRLQPHLPIVRITSPPSGIYVRTSSQAIAWTVDDVPQTSNLVAFLSEGPNTIIRSYTDSKGATGADTIVVTLDNTPPFIELIHPRQSAAVLDPEMDVRWKVDGVERIPVHHTMDTSGANQVLLAAVDSAGNTDTLLAFFYPGTEVPHLIGKSYFAAESLLTQASLDGDTTWEDNDTASTGIVFAQSPAAGDSLRLHWRVRYKLSRGADAVDLAATSLDTKDVLVNAISLEAAGSVRIALENLGRAAVTDSFGILVFEDRNRDQRYSSGTDFLLGRITSLDPIGPGDSAVFDVPVSGMLSFNGNRLSAFVDASDRIFETDEGNNTIHSMAKCRKLPLQVDYTPRIKWEWMDSTNNGVASLSITPKVGHLTDDNGDGKYDSKDIPAILVGTDGGSFNGTLTAINGRDGHQLWQKDVNPRFGAHLSIGDIDRDGVPEIVVIERGPPFIWYNRILILDNQGNRKDSSEWQFFGSIGFGTKESVTLSDLDGDGWPEIIWGQNIFNRRAQLIYPKRFSTQYARLKAADLDMDGYQELVGRVTLPNEISPKLSIFIFKDKNLTSRLSGLFDVQVPIIAKVDSDPRIIIHNVTTTDSIGGLKSFNTGLAGAQIIPPTDFLNAGASAFSLQNIMNDDFYFGKDSLRLYYTVGSGGSPGVGSRPVFVRTNMRDSSVTYRVFPRGVTTNSVNGRGTVFDFEDNNDPKVVMQSQDSLYIVDSAGTTLGKTGYGPHFWPYGVTVADVDNDGHADIVTGGKGSVAKLAVFSNQTWVGARTIYNENDYTVTNINDDGSIPRFPTPVWQANNSTNIQCTEGHYACVDISASWPQFVQDSAGGDTLTARIGNGGALPLPEGIPVTLYAGHIGAEIRVATLKSPQRLEAGEYYAFRYPLADSLRGAYVFRVAADDSGNGKGGLDEIDEINNSVALSLMINNHAPVFSAHGNRYSEPGAVFSDTLSAGDPDGDSVTYRLVKAPAGMSIGLQSGIISWMTPDSLPRCTVKVAASDPYQATATSSLVIYIGNAGNIPPHIVSTPDTSVLLNTLGQPISHAFRYLIQAIDSDGVSLEYEAECLNCDGVAGAKPELIGNRLLWIPVDPPWTAGDSLRMAVKVIDERGGVDSQVFTIRLSDPSVAGNQLPGFVTAPPRTAVAGADYVYAAKAADGDGDAITYFLSAAPDNMNLAGGTVHWQTPSTPGLTVDVDLRATDTHNGHAHQIWRITLIPDDVPPSVSIGFSQNPLQPGHPVTVTVNAADNVALSASALTRDGSPVTLTNGRYTFTPADSGVYAFAATAEDTSGNIGHATGLLRVSAAADNSPPAISLSHSPSNPMAGDLITFTVAASDDMGLDAGRVWIRVDGKNILVHDGEAEYRALRPGNFIATAVAYDMAGNSAIGSDAVSVSPLGGDATAPTAQIVDPEEDFLAYSRVNVTGTAHDSHLAYYTLSYRDLNDSGWVEFSRSTTPVSSGTLGVVDATNMVNGDYEIRLNVYDQSGNASSSSTQITVSGEKKVGNFTLAFEDLTVPMAGLDLSVTRTYDSRVKAVGDFGIGWKMGMRSISLSENRNQGTEWSMDLVFGFIPRYVVNPLKAHTVTVTLPGGRKQEFTAAPEFYSPFDPSFGTMTYRPKPGTNSKLESVSTGEFIFMGGEIYDLNGTFEAPYDPQVYKLTLMDGSYFIIDQDKGGVTESGDANGNVLAWDRSSISHNAGSGIDISRDEAGRITGIGDGAGRSVQYVYDVIGNLSKVVDPNGNSTLFKYGPDSYLNEIVDSRGVRANRTEYDDEGRIVRQINANGDTLHLNHDIDRNLEEIVDFNGHVTSYGYDLHGNVVRKMDDAGNQWFYSYDSSDNLLSTLAPDGTLKTSTYDAHGNELSSTDELGNTVERTFNDNGKPETITDAMGRTTEFVYDGSGNLTKEVGPDGVVQAERAYDGQGNVIAEKDALGRITRHTYNSRGWLQSSTDALAHTRRFGHDAAGNLIFEVNALGDTTRYAYDKNGNRTLTVNATGDTTRTEYNAISKAFKQTDALGRVTRFTYNNLGDKIQDIAPDSAITEREYDAQGNVSAIYDPLDRVTRMQYDFENRVVRTTNPDNSFSRTVYDALGRRSESFDANGNATQYEYDDAGRNTLVRDALGHETHFEYDVLGRKSAMVDALGQRIQYSYDLYDRLTTTTFPDGSTKLTDYDAAGRKIRETDQNLYETRFEYDEVGNLTAVVDNLNHRTEYTYDANNNRLTQKDAKGHTTTMEYDVLGRMVRKTYPNGEEERWTYDANGNALSHAKGNDSTAYEYDLRDRETKRTHFPGGHEVVTTYTLDGKRETVTAYNGETQFAYDNRGRLFREDIPNGDFLEHRYDANGNRTSLTTPFGVTGYRYDELNRMDSVASPQNQITEYRYNAVGNRDSVINANGTTVGYTYDTQNRLTELRNRNASGVLLSRYQYSLNYAGIRTGVHELDGSHVTYGYDGLYRLTSESRTGSHAYINTFTYDNVGNRLTQAKGGVTTTYDYNSRDQLLSESNPSGSTTYTYDPAGRMVSKTDAAGTTTYTWVDEDRMASVTGPGISVNYEYDADGRRVKETVGGISKQYLIDRQLPYGQVVLETDGAGNLNASFTYGLERISQSRGGVTHNYLADGQGSIRQLTDTTGSVSDTWDYTAFGELLARTGTTENRFTYTGEEFDPNSGFIYLRARWMDPKVGRFIGVDPYEGDPQAPTSLHRYLYANASPLYFVDPSGEFGITDFAVGRAVVNTLGRIQTTLAFNYYRILLWATAAGGASKSVLGHILNKHSFEGVARQVPFVLAKSGRAAADAFVRSRSYFPVEWTESRIQQAVGVVNRDAFRRGVTNGLHTLEIAGEKITIALENGKIKTAYGAVNLTLDDFGL
jgi:RHS repeat-associated protein